MTTYEVLSIISIVLTTLLALSSLFNLIKVLHKQRRLLK